jgi:hypothetical protein
VSDENDLEIARRLGRAHGEGARDAGEPLMGTAWLGYVAVGEMQKAGVDLDGPRLMTLVRAYIDAAHGVSIPDPTTPYDKKEAPK